MILLKLLYAMGNRPDFGTTYDNNPDGLIQKWISQVKALVDRVGISRSVEFRAALQTTAQYWQPATRLIQIITNDAIEELKLELELYQDENIGRIYEANERHRFKADVLNIVCSADTEVFVVDPYLDSEIFSLLFENNASFTIRALCFQYFPSVNAYAKSFSSQHSRVVAVKKSNLLHDRVIIVDDDCWLVGASLKDGGIKPTYLMPLPPTLSAEKIRIYNKIWDQS